MQVSESLLKVGYIPIFTVPKNFSGPKTRVTDSSEGCMEWGNVKRLEAYKRQRRKGDFFFGIIFVKIGTIMFKQ